MEFSTKFKFNQSPGSQRSFHWERQMKGCKTFACSIFSMLAILASQHQAQAQITQLEHSSTSYVGTIPDGPSVDNVKARFVNNTSGNTFTVFNPEISITASFSHQAYTDVQGTSTKTGNFFGGTVNNSKKEVTKQTVWRILNSISDPGNNMFTSNPTGTAGQGIEVNVNHGFNMFTSVEPLWKADKALDGRYYYSTLTLTFNRAISNPVLHIVGLGATTTVENRVHGFATELELHQPPTGITLEKLSGSSALRVSDNKILNNRTRINDDSGDGAATGSIRVKGNNITQLVFKVYLRGDDYGREWSASKMFAGDQWLMAFSMNASSISGNIFDDGNALTDSKVNPVPTADGKGTNVDDQLYVNLINSSNEIVATSSVGDDGAYVFQDIIAPAYPATYKIVVTDGPTKKTSSLPEGWVNTGEFKGLPTANGNDGTVDGILGNLTLTNATTIITNANFGIEKIPVSYAKNEPIQANPGGSIKVAVPTLIGTDLEDGDYVGTDKKNTIKITSLPTPETGILYYNNTPVTVNQIISNYDPSKLTVDPANGSPTVTFNYSHKDAADQYALPVAVTLPFYAVYAISGNIFDDGDGLTLPGNKVDGASVKGSDADPEAAGNQPVYVSLVNGTDVVATVMVNNDGTYNFSNVRTGDYKVILQKEGLAGSTSASLPTNWKNTGENQGAPTVEGSDGTVDGQLSFSVVDTDLTNLNFGINKISVADAKKQTIVTPVADAVLSGTGSNPPALSGWDFEDKTLGGNNSKVVITSLPTNGELYYKGAKVTATNLVLDNQFDASQLTFKFSGTGYNKIQFDYAFMDEAGMIGIAATYELNWSGALPVTLTKFTVSKSEQSAVLSWITTAETNSERFDIQHSTDGKEWHIIGNVYSRGESSELINYSFTHVDPVNGENLYRLKMVDRDGTFAYSRINSLLFGEDLQTSVYPNPAVSIVKVKVDGQSDLSKVKSIKVFDTNGRIVLLPGTSTDEINVQNLGSGLYLMQVTRNNGITSTLKMSIKK